MFNNQVLLGAGPPQVSAGGSDALVASFAPGGEVRWARGFGGKGDDISYGVAVAPGGAVFVTGRFEGSCDFGDGPRTSKGKGDVFLLKLLQ